MKFQCTHTQTITKVVEIEITAKNLKEAEQINDDWQIEQGNIKKVKILNTEVQHGDYDQSTLREI